MELLEEAERIILQAKLFTTSSSILGFVVVDLAEGLGLNLQTAGQKERGYLCFWSKTWSNQTMRLISLEFLSWSALFWKFMAASSPKSTAASAVGTEEEVQDANTGKSTAEEFRNGDDKSKQQHVEQGTLYIMIRILIG